MQMAVSIQNSVLSSVFNDSEKWSPGRPTKKDKLTSQQSYQTDIFLLYAGWKWAEWGSSVGP